MNSDFTPASNRAFAQQLFAEADERLRLAEEAYKMQGREVIGWRWDAGGTLRPLQPIFTADSSEAEQSPDKRQVAGASPARPIDGS